MSQYTEVLSSGQGEPGGGPNRKLLVFGGIGLAVVLIAGIIGVWWVNRDDGTPTASDNTTQTPQPQQTTPPASPEPSNPFSPSPEPTSPTSPEPSNPPAAGRVTFTPLGSPWETSDTLGTSLLGNGMAQTADTEPNYNGEGSNWVALASSGWAQPGWAGKDAKTTAGNVAQWFATSNFNDAKVDRQPLGTSAIKVSGVEGVLLKEHFSYNIPDLSAKGETVYIAVIPVKGSPIPGVFLGSVPDTNKALQKDVEKAIQSLKVES